MSEDVESRSIAEELDMPEMSDPADMMAEMEEQFGATVTDDFTAAFADEEYVWEIPVGKFDSDGHPILLTVKAKDPRESDLPTRYMTALERSPDRAVRMLWDACIAEPRALVKQDNFDRLTSAFKNSLTYRLLALIGVNRDFFEGLMSMAGQKGRRRPTKSSSPSPSASASPQSKSEAGTPKTSSPLTDLLKTEVAKKGWTASLTEDGSSPEPSPARKAEVSSTPSSKKSEESRSGSAKVNLS